MKISQSQGWQAGEGTFLSTLGCCDLNEISRMGKEWEPLEHLHLNQVVLPVPTVNLRQHFTIGGAVAARDYTLDW